MVDRLSAMVAVVMTFLVATAPVTVVAIPGGLHGATNASTLTTAAGTDYEVSNLSAPGSVVQGDTVNVSAEVTNNGTANGTQTVEFRFDLDQNGTLEADETLANKTVSLNASESTTVSFSVDSGGVPPGTYTHGVVTENETATATITVQKPATFDVSNLSAPSSVVDGELVNVSATITNTGDVSGTETVEFRLSGATLANETVSLNASENTTVEFSISTSDPPPGTYTHGVYTADDNETAQLTILAPANFAVSDLSAPANVTTGENVTVTATVNNTGEATATKTVAFRFDLDQNGTLEASETLASESVSLNASENTTVSFTVNTAGVPAGTYTHGVVTPDDDATATIDVEKTVAPLNLSVDFTEVFLGDSFVFSVTREDTGAAVANATVTVAGDNVSRTMTTDANGTAEVTVNATGTFTATASKADTDFVDYQDDSLNVTVKTPPELAPFSDTSPLVGRNVKSPSLSGKFRVESTYAQDTTVEIVRNTSTDYSINITIPSRLNATNVTFYIQTQAIESSQNISDLTLFIDGQKSRFYVDASAGPGNSPWIGFVVDEFSTRTVTFSSTAPSGTNFTVSGLSAPANATAGETITAAATVTNEGDAGSQAVAFRFDLDQNGTLEADETIATKRVELDANASTTVSFDVDTTGIPPGAYTHGIVTRNDSQSASITIDPYPAPSVVADPATAGVTAEHTVAVEVGSTANGSSFEKIEIQYGSNFSQNGGNVSAVAGDSSTVLRLGLDTDADGAIEVDMSGSVSTSGDKDTLTVANSSGATMEAGDIVIVEYADVTNPDAGDYNVTVTLNPQSAAETSNATLTTTATPYFAVSGLSAPANATSGDTVNVSATITNTGIVADTQTVEFRFDLDQDGTLEAGETLANETVSLNASENTTVDFSVPTDGVPAGTYTHGVVTENETGTATITIERATVALNLSVDVQTVDLSESFVFTVTREDTGAAVENATVTVAGGNYSQTFTTDANGTVETVVNTTGNFTATATAPDTATATFTADSLNVTVQTPPELAPFRDTSPLKPQAFGPNSSSLSGKFRVESQYADNTTVALARNTSTEYAINITIPSELNATDVTFYIQTTAIESSQNISNLALFIDGQKSRFFVDQSAGPGNSPWIGFVVQEFSTKTVSFQSTSTTNVTAGDVTGDGTVDTGDVIQVQRSIVGLTTFSSSQTDAADVTGDGTVDTGDVIQIQRFIVGLRTSL